MRQTPRPDQERVVAEALAFARAGRKRIQIWAPTGMGKTTIAAMLAERTQEKAAQFNKPARTWMLTHRHEIAAQAAERFAEQGIRVGVCQGEVMSDPAAPTQVVSMQTLVARLRRKTPHLPDGRPQLVIVDESHHLISETWWQAVKTVLGDGVLIMLSATPWATGGGGLGIAEALVKGPSQRELVELGVLVPPDIFCGPAPDVKRLSVRAGDFAAEALATVSMDLAGDVVATWQRLAAGKRTICFAVNLPHSMALVERWRAVGVAAEHVDWATPPKERKEIFARLSTGETTVVSNLSIVTEGFDCPAIDACVLARATKSDKLYLQSVGRALRASPGKTSAIILDHGNNAFRHGHPFLERQIHLVGGEVRRKAKEVDKDDQERFLLCAKCMMANALDARNCKHCGALIVRKAPPKERKAIALVRFQDLSEEARSQGKIMERRADWYRLCAMARSKSWSPWATSFRYKSQHGIMPHEDQIFFSDRERGMYWSERKGRKRA